MSCAAGGREKGLWPQFLWEFAHLRRTSKTWLTVRILLFSSWLAIPKYLVCALLFCLASSAPLQPVPLIRSIDLGTDPWPQVRNVQCKFRKRNKGAVKVTVRCVCPARCHTSPGLTSKPGGYFNCSGYRSLCYALFTTIMFRGLSWYFSLRLERRAVRVKALAFSATLFMSLLWCTENVILKLL